MLFGLPLALLAGALAFYPVNNRPFSFFLEAIFNYLSKQRLYLWRKRSETVHKNTSDTPQRSDRPVIATPPVTRHPKQNITSLARKLELQALQKNQ